jgi:hypothetical protein
VTEIPPARVSRAKALTLGRPTTTPTPAAGRSRRRLGWSVRSMVETHTGHRIIRCAAVFDDGSQREEWVVWVDDTHYAWGRDRPAALRSATRGGLDVEREPFPIVEAAERGRIFPTPGAGSLM